MARGKGKAPAKQSSLRAAGLLPTLKKPAEAIGLVVHTPGEFWEGCAAMSGEMRSGPLFS